MPLVGKKKFAYTPAGKKQAAAYASKIKKTGTYKGKSNKLGGGGRFAQVVAAAKKGGAKNPAAVAAMVGRKNGAAKMTKMATAGRARAARKKK
jgi:hypothetical protein